MKLKFSKMHGLGNDFVVIDGVRQTVTLTADRLRQLGDRHLGIGFDQLLLVEAPQSQENDFRYRIFNNDGSEVEQCGNGARCFVKFVTEQRLSNKRAIRVETARGVIVPELGEGGLITVDMGAPRFAPLEIPFLGSQPCRYRTGQHARPADRAPQPLPRARQRRFHADRWPQ